MESRPLIGARVRTDRGVRGTVSGYPKKAKHLDKVFVKKDGIEGANAVTLVKISNLVVEPDT